MYRTDRPDGRYLSTMGFSHGLMRDLKPQLAFDPNLSARELPAWQERVRAKLRELMAFPDVPKPPGPKQLWSEPRDGYRLEKWESYPEPGCAVPLLMLVPDGVSAANPCRAVLCFPGSQTSKELLAGEPELSPEQKRNRHRAHNQMALWYARAGMVAVVMDNPSTAELAESVVDWQNVDRGRDALSTELIFMGRNYLGLSVFQKMHILEWVRGLDFVDAARVAVSGHSLGTEPAMVMGALDTGIKAVVFNDFLCNNQQRFVVQGLPEDGVWSAENRLWHLVPGLLKWFDFPDLLAAVAPRHLLISEGGVTFYLNRLRRAYDVLDASENYQVCYYPKYRTPEDRKHDSEQMPEGLTDEEYYEYANVDVPNHYFKEDVAVPWLSDVL